MFQYIYSCGGSLYGLFLILIVSNVSWLKAKFDTTKDQDYRNCVAVAAEGGARYIHYWKHSGEIYLSNIRI